MLGATGPDYYITGVIVWPVEVVCSVVGCRSGSSVVLCAALMAAGLPPVFVCLFHVPLLREMRLRLLI